jgi:glycosidase
VYKRQWILFICIIYTNNISAQSNSPEILYHVCQRSFYDSNGDEIGDFKGLQQKLDYLEDLGITSILLLPIYESVFYHNYFPIDFKRIDPTFGTEEEFIELVKAIHQKGMKIYMDMEIHYITEDHLWYKDSYANPSSPYSEYILYNDKENKEPESIVYDLKTLTGYDGVTKKVMTLDLYNDKCKAYIYDLFKYWLDPNQDGHFDDGVDGFRIDHMMDDLDWKGIVTNMHADYWKPLFDQLRAINPNVIIMGEQADWGDYGEEYFTKADLDWLFAFGAKSGINNFNKQEIISKYDSAFAVTPKGKDQVIFIENHDVTRFASLVESHEGKLKVGAALNLLLKGIPSLYYGQEIGMLGETGKFIEAIDGNHIPVREAFEWTSDWDKEGIASWYRDSGPWWTASNLKNADGISLEEQQNDPNSLWQFYRKMIHLHKKYAALWKGEIEFIENQNEQVISFLRTFDNEQFLIHINLSEVSQEVILPEKHSSLATNILSNQRKPTSVESFSTLKAFEIVVLQLTNP